MRLKLLAIAFVCSVGLILASPSVAHATAIIPGPVTLTFNDLTDILTTTVSGAPTDTSRVTGVSCFFDAGDNAEECLATIAAPPGFMASPNMPSETFITIGETGLTSGLISDGLILANQGNSVQVVFLSDTDPSTFGACSPQNPCLLIENGQVQVAATITWVPQIIPTVDGAVIGNIVDTLQFQSDVEATAPEPATMVLLTSGLALIALRRRFSPRG